MAFGSFGETRPVDVESDLRRQLDEMLEEVNKLRAERNQLERQLIAAHWCMTHTDNCCQGCPAEDDEALCDTVPAVGCAGLIRHEWQPKEKCATCMHAEQHSGTSADKKG